jgi:hypothetical protein
MQELMRATDIEIATSCYGARGLIIGSGLSPIRTSIGGPRWPLGYELAGSCEPLMPTRPMLKMDREPYRKMYRDRLALWGVSMIAEMLEALVRPGDRGVVLLCFEGLKKPGEWCHRSMFAEYWEEKTGQAVRELGGACPHGKAQGQAQGKLFG